MTCLCRLLPAGSAGTATLLVPEAGSSSCFSSPRIGHDDDCVGRLHVDGSSRKLNLSVKNEEHQVRNREGVSDMVVDGEATSPDNIALSFQGLCIEVHAF